MRKADRGPDVDQLRKLGYETRDIALPTIIQWFVVLGIFIAVASAVSYGIYRLFLPEIGNEAKPGTFAMAPPAPNPEIQALPKMDLATFRKQEDEKLDNYAWIDRQKGVARIPIDDAIATIAKRGLPHAKPGPVPPAPPGQQPGAPTGPGFQVAPGEPGSQLPGQAGGAAQGSSSMPTSLGGPGGPPQTQGR